MSDYFGYDVHFVMNITDIEDKVRVCDRTLEDPHACP
jgi:cysteinyl-tRNA synthetase